MTSSEDTNYFNNTPTIPENIKSPRAKLVYLFIYQKSATTIDQICDALNITKISTLPIIKNLIRKDHVYRENEKYHIKTQPTS